MKDSNKVHVALPNVLQGLKESSETASIVSLLENEWCWREILNALALKIIIILLQLGKKQP